MSVDGTDIVEREVKGWPGWTKVQMGGSRRYKSPGGIDISPYQFMRLVADYKSQGYIPENVIQPDDGRTNAKAKPFMKTASPSKKKQESLDDVPRQQTIEEIVADNELHTGKTTIGGKKHPRPTQAALAIGFKNVLLLITAYIIAGMVVHDDRAALSEQEASVLGIVFANLFKDTDWNERYGWVIADTGDWQALGVVLFQYISRLNDIRVERVQQTKAQKQGVPQQQYQPQPTLSNGNQPVTSQQPFLRSGGFATPIVRPGQGG